MDKESQEMKNENTAEDIVQTLSNLAKKIKLRKKINVHAIEEEYEERWKRAQLTAKRT